MIGRRHRQRLDALTRRGALVVARRGEVVRHAEVDDEIAIRDDPGEADGLFRFLHGQHALLGVAGRVREVGAPDALDQAVGDRRVDAVQREARLAQPLAEPRRGGLVAIVEVRARREQLDAVEAPIGDGLQMSAIERRVMEKMGGDPESHVGLKNGRATRPRNFPSYTQAGRQRRRSISAR